MEPFQPGEVVVSYDTAGNSYRYEFKRLSIVVRVNGRYAGRILRTPKGGYMMHYASGKEKLTGAEHGSFEEMQRTLQGSVGEKKAP